MMLREDIDEIMVKMGSENGHDFRCFGCVGV